VPSKEPINGVYRVEPEGIVRFGPTHGSVPVVDLTIDEAIRNIEKHLKKSVKEPKVSISLEQTRGGQNAKVEKLLCHRQVSAIDEKKDASGKRVQFDRLVASELDVNNEDGPIIAVGPQGKVEQLNSVSALTKIKAEGLEYSEATHVMKLTRILFEGR